MTRVYERLARRPAAFRHMTGMTENEFEALYWQAAPLLEEERLERLNARPRQRAMGAGGQYKNDIRNRLLMGLIWLRIYPIYEVLGFLFDLHKSNVSRNLEPVLEVLHQLLGDEVAWPDEEQRKKKGMDQFLVLAQTYRHPRENHNRAFEIVAGLVNRRIRRRQCSVALA